MLTGRWIEVRHTLAERPAPLHTALAHTGGVSVNTRGLQLLFVGEHTPPLPDGQLTGVFGGVGVLHRERHLLHPAIPRVLGALFQPGCFFGRMDIDL